MEKLFKQWPGENFLLQNEPARRLYFDVAKDLPIIDYHCHLSPEEIATNKQFANLTEIWLKGDHYKWRAMRALGIAEELVTGAATDEEKFKAWASIAPRTVRNPLFHWSAMELANPFGIHEFLNSETADSIYRHCNELLNTDAFRTQALIHNRKVEMVGTTDDPCDDLRHHQAFTKREAGFKVLPSFRPDPILNVTN
jgi:glucuronate isomerase